MLNIAHRGAAGYEPENTLKAFRKAIQLGADMIELDVRLCKTGELIVMHDAKVNRTTNGRGKVVKKTLENIRHLDAGKGEKVPTLTHALNSIRRKARVNIELKGKKTAAPVSKIIEHYVKDKGWSYSDFLVSSFNHRELKRFKGFSPRVRIGALTMKRPKRFIKLVRRLDPFSINISKSSINRRFMKTAGNHSIKVMAYTVNKNKDIKKMKELGVDGIFTDFPDRV